MLERTWFSGMILFIVLLEITAKVQHESNVFTEVSAMVTSKMNSTLLRLVTCLRKNIGIQCERIKVINFSWSCQA
jgi:hypothetical protein